MTQLGIFTAETPTPSFAPFVYDAPDGDEIIVDSFAGGGGASEGIRRALGYSPHIAINHDAPAIALHSANHPDSEHFPKNVWRIDPVAVCRGRPVGLMWLSPDCTHFSKAKGAKPVSKKIRGLAWVAVRWARAVQPRVIVLENVEEFEKWGPLYPSDHPNPKLRDRPIPAKQGHTYKAFVRKLKRLGYEVEKRQLVACDYGAPTSRKRLFIIARCDGEPIVWPKPTHGPGRSHPWRTAAECIDWTIPVHSIFLTAEDAKRLWKEQRIRIKRPLVANTLRRIGRGVWRFVINNPKPFIIPIDNRSNGAAGARSILDPVSTITREARHALVTPFIAGVGGRQGQSPERSIDRPYQTITGKADSVVVAPIVIPVAPFITKFRAGSDGSSIEAPMPTVTANSYIKRPGGAVPLGLVSPFLSPVTHAGDQRVHSIEEPVRTITGANRGEEALIAPVMIPRYGEFPDHPARGTTLDQPMPTVVPTQNGAQLCATFLAKNFGGHETPGSQLDAPMHTVTDRDHHALVATHIQRDFGKSIGAEADKPLPTITGGAGGHAALVASSVVKFKGTARDGQPLDEPLHTVQSGGNHYAEVRAFLLAYYGNEKRGRDLLNPMPTATADDRFGIVTVRGQDYVIVDIGTRMLVPRELARAQGFHDSYILDIEFDGKPLSKEAQTSMIGNSVSPDHACAIVQANYRPRTIRRREFA
jgi:DNA (cytosine-5)-methyltransferase 1